MQGARKSNTLIERTPWVLSAITAHVTGMAEAQTTTATAHRRWWWPGALAVQGVRLCQHPTPQILRQMWGHTSRAQNQTTEEGAYTTTGSCSEADRSTRKEGRAVREGYQPQRACDRPRQGLVWRRMRPTPHESQTTEMPQMPTPTAGTHPAITTHTYSSWANRITTCGLIFAIILAIYIIIRGMRSWPRTKFCCHH